MSIYSIRHRWGMGPKVDPHFDARVGRIAAALDSNGGNGEPPRASGYVELDGDDPWGYLQEMLAALYAPTPAQAIAGEIDGQQRPLAWTQITRIRYLTTDPACGVALPMYDFMPRPDAVTPEDRQAALADAIARLHAATGGKLAQARRIGLTVGFKFDVIARSLLPAFNPGFWRMLGAGRLQWAQENVNHVLCGGGRPASALGMLFGSGASRRPFGAQKLGLSCSAGPQLSKAMLLLQQSPPSGPATGYGIDATGSGTIVGIVDCGCDFAHPSFRDPARPNGSRILALWDQNDGPGAPPVVTVGGVDHRFGHGRLFTRADFERVLAGWQATPGDSDFPYRELQYDPHDKHYAASSPALNGAHGTFVMEVAAGGPRAEGGTGPAPRGVAPEADIVFVHLRQRERGGRHVLDLNDVVDAVAFIFHVAEREGKPCVVNLSLNTMSGPHDGDGYFDRRLSDLLRSGSAGPEAKGRAVVIAAGNLPTSGEQRVRWQHLADEVTAAAPFTFHWRMAAQDATRNMVEIWYDATDAWLQVTLVSPEGERLGPVKPGRAAELMAGSEWRGSVIGSRLLPKLRANDLLASDSVQDTDEAPGRHVILLQLHAPSPSEVQWQVILEVATDTAPPPPTAARVKFDAWLERDDEGPSGLSRGPGAPDIDPRDRPRTLGTLSCGADAIVVGGYSTFTGVQAWNLSGLGPTRREVHKPDLAGPAHEITLVLSRRGHTVPVAVRPQNGTSLAAPFVTGTIACVYQRNPRATLAEVRRALVDTALPLPDTPAGWTGDLGHGRLHPAGVLALFPAASTAAASAAGPVAPPAVPPTP